MQGGKGVTLAPKEGLDSITHTYTQSSRKAGCVHHLIPSFDPGVLKTSHTVDHTLPSSDCFALQREADNLTGVQRVFVGFPA